MKVMDYAVVGWVLFAVAGTAIGSDLPLSAVACSKAFPLNHQGVVVWTGKLSSKRKPLSTHIVDGTLKGDVQIGEHNLLVITGEGKVGYSWRIVVDSGTYSTDLYTGDLDKNGFTDIVAKLEYIGDGRGPSQLLKVWCFDKNWKPQLSELSVYGDPNSPTFLGSIVDLNRDGKAEFIEREDTASEWISNLYEISEMRLKKINGSFGGFTFPLVSHEENRRRKSYSEQNIHE